VAAEPSRHACSVRGDAGQGAIDEVTDPHQRDATAPAHEHVLLGVDAHDDDLV